MVRVAMEQVVLLVLGFLPSSVIPPPIRIHSLHSVVGTKGPKVAAALRDSLSYSPPPPTFSRSRRSVLGVATRLRAGGSGAPIPVGV